MNFFFHFVTYEEWFVLVGGIFFVTLLIFFLDGKERTNPVIYYSNNIFYIGMSFSFLIYMPIINELINLKMFPYEWSKLSIDIMYLLMLYFATLITGFVFTLIFDFIFQVGIFEKEKKNA